MLWGLCNNKVEGRGVGREGGENTVRCAEDMMRSLRGRKYRPGTSARIREGPLKEKSIGLYSLKTPCHYSTVDLITKYRHYKYSTAETYAEAIACRDL